MDPILLAAANAASTAATNANTAATNASTAAAANIPADLTTALTAAHAAQTAISAQVTAVTGFVTGIGAALGDDGGTPQDAHYVGQDIGPGRRSGLEALKDADSVSIILAPGRTSTAVQNALIA